MPTISLSFNNLVSGDYETLGVILLAGVNYTAGMVLVSQSTGRMTNAAVTLSGAAAVAPQLNFDAQMVGVLVESVDATGGDKAGVVIVKGDFNVLKLTFAAGQTGDLIRGTLASKNITFRIWRK